MKLVVVGAEGRMGRMLIRAVAEAEGCTLHGAIERPGSPALGQDAGRLAGIGDLGVPVSDDPLSRFVAADGVLDFTAPAATVAFAELAAQARIVHIVGTTGLSADDLKRLEAASYHARIVRSGNMSLGVNLLAGLVRKVAATLGEEFDIEVLEMHHRMKVDAPSGTALLLGEAAAEGRRVALAETRVSTRDGHTGARRPGDIGFATLRGGSVVGDHSVIFAGPSERITLSHHAEDRAIFARGAVRAAQWAFDKPPGLYGMDDVLGLRD
ncbi:Dihydrodipicolinate reductase [Methylorubrum populi BJ001]|jgi:4-hydroxy-tetrahydrodipicolinate reductase|uniref:4-hydroxy-tetrahydrodipicolinate reductase n=1 Tax=Methylorubrum populi (strain ATCC BAA-705 / NCIMB 13946 / BJ001) TaxID=441620 RepID=B1ZA87_METPB|nr:4-hydroxy-tetrahydrodipicolinate reductase [Methylorubrum populi]ACB80597.1 Dihydrodipicolinate reductase [Methylorubrum populi BJ001]OAH33353.1 4-hydroxy-tetrahydrodipicolinate reductase [Methylorubrum populi]PZP66563.1 MAG: 4-hydroxy-tetrahydrodipicolinate reductase [Methylorubrum populi]